ncbi:MAG: anhydro-N-acetylmuramic acid kinase [Gallionellales bacterium RIFCSPLOWO2_02_60_31]|nr:MAG: anhydro-N-acetylmuramic acid kinase [Gallionellales bacterium RIFCSPLOWO2_02_60_31]
MSGTSLDGVDAVLADLSRAQPKLLAKHYLPFDDALRNELLALHQPGHNELHRTQLAGNQLARLYAAAVNALLNTANSSGAKIKAIGCHGQTIRHRPEHGYTLQIGNAALLAELTGIAVVSDFRSRDIAAGGQGAPLVPAFHDKVMRHPDSHRVIVNIGGISNLTNLPPNASTSGFDCGPGNLLMDAWCMQHLGRPYDDSGIWAASGKALPALLERMLDEPFFALPPPKSSGRDLFDMAWLRGKLQGGELAEDVQATLLELTCRSIAQAIRQHCAGATEIYLCGGGAHNQTLHRRLAALLPGSSVQTTDVLGVDGDYLEAIAFAWLAQQTLHGKPASLPLVTGARHPCILGAIYPA